jgi:FtsZ-binding cell division protein ZapB
MRQILIVLLIGVCVWLIVDRHGLTQKVAVLEERLSTTEKQRDELKRRLQIVSEPQKNWLQERIEQNGRSLEVPPSRVFSPGGNRPPTSNSRIIR